MDLRKLFFIFEFSNKILFMKIIKIIFKNGFLIKICLNTFFCFFFFTSQDNLIDQSKHWKCECS